MKKMTCKQLGRACDLVLEGNTFEEIAKQSKQHGMKMHQAGDIAHLEAMKRIQDLMQDPKAMVKLLDDKKKEFEAS